MDEIPAGWPPAELFSAPVPIFPLPGLFLFPGQVLPLHFFEPRYRQMVEDSLDGPGRIVIASVIEGDADADVPRVLPVGGLGEIARHEKLPDGRFLTWILGLARVRIDEVPSDRPYRLVSYEIVEDVVAGEVEADRLRAQLAAAIETCTGQELEDVDEISPAQLADILAQCVTAPQAVMEQIYAESRVVARAEQVLEAFTRYPPRKPGSS